MNLAKRPVRNKDVLMGRWIVFLGCLLVSTVGYASPKDYYYEQHLRRQERTQLTGQLIGVEAAPLTLDQWIDHDDPQKGTFAQRYFVDSSHAESETSPVLFYICGEAPCGQGDLDHTSVDSFAKQFKAHKVALEHRYYGESLPTAKFRTEDLRYLTTANALKDLARFQRWIKEKRGWKGKWVVFGGSYAGSLAAYYRAKYPEDVVGALSSSGPVKADDNFDEYDRHVAGVVGAECAGWMREAVKTAEDAEGDPLTLAHFKKLFEAEMIEDFEDFLYTIADVGAVAVQYGMVVGFCDSLRDSPLRIEGYAKFARRIWASWGISPVDLSVQGALSENPQDYTATFGMRPWLYQSCTEYGYWQNAHPETSVRSKRINADYHAKTCKRLFGITAPANVNLTNQTYYEPLLNPGVSQILFTNGSRDPWSALSIASNNQNATNPNTEAWMIDGASHCDDLRVPSLFDPEPLKAARQRLRELLAQWLR
jgi:pimeloyl-ACP methyl ester carboxylesterase